MPANIFVVGLDAANRRELDTLPGAEQYRFHELLDSTSLTRGTIEFDESLNRAEAELEAFDGPVDAIVGYWDFPVSSLVPLLCARRGLPGPDLASVLMCEHKYWSRLKQQESITDHPRFSLLELDSTRPPPGVPYPMWIKPVKSASSELAFHVTDDHQLRAALSKLRESIGRVGDAFDSALAHAEVPREIAEIGGRACLAEEAVSGQQVTVEGFHDGTRVHVYGVIDSHNYEGTPCFQRYQYPSQLPGTAIDRLVDIATRVIGHIGLRSAFNIEFFWDAETERINLLEINPRISQSHAMLFEQVDGVSNHHCMVRLALGHTPALPHRRGPYPVAAKWFCRRFSADARVTRSPTAEEVAELERDVPGVHIEIGAERGMRLSDLPAQDSYSYNLAVVHVGANTQQELHDKYQHCARSLRFEFDE